MKRFDTPAQPEGAESTASYFSHGLLAKIIHSDQSLARPTEQVLRRRWVNRMILAEVGFVLGVVLLQFFPVIEDSSAATSPQPTPTITITAPTATIEPSPEATQSSDVLSATTIAALPQPAVTPIPAVVVPAALPDTGRDGVGAGLVYAAPLLCIGGGLTLWLLAGARSTHDLDSAASSADGEGPVV
ncbi:MAG TPA: hypothetical protein VGD69_23275 [Herpetosiphonaceae bacterium]